MALVCFSSRKPCFLWVRNRQHLTDFDDVFVVKLVAVGVKDLFVLHHVAVVVVGDFAEAKFDSTGATVEIEAKTSAGGNDDDTNPLRVEGVITAIDLDNKKVTIRTWSGNLVEVVVAPTTKIERNDLHVTLAAFKVGDRGEARFDVNGVTLKIEAEGV